MVGYNGFQLKPCMFSQEGLVGYMPLHSNNGLYLANTIKFTTKVYCHGFYKNHLSTDTCKGYFKVQDSKLGAVYIFTSVLQCP